MSHHDCRLCKETRNKAAFTLEKALDRDPEYRTTAENLMADEIERLRQFNYKLQADVAYLAAWKDEIEKGLARMEGGS